MRKFFLLCFSRRKRTFEKISTKLIKENGYKKDSYPHFHLPSKDTNHQTPSHARVCQMITFFSGSGAERSRHRLNLNVILNSKVMQLIYEKKHLQFAFYSHSYITVYNVPISVSGSVSAPSVRMRMDGHIIINILKLMTLTLTSPVACSRCIVHGMSSNCHNHILIKLQSEQATLQLRKVRPCLRQF